jgi:hypothetical protein
MHTALTRIAIGDLAGGWFWLSSLHFGLIFHSFWSVPGPSQDADAVPKLTVNDLSDWA